MGYGLSLKTPANNYFLFTVDNEFEYDNSYYDIPDSALGIAVAGDSKIY